MTDPQYVIINRKTHDFWSVELGWVDTMEAADKFSAHELGAHDLAMDGKWILDTLAQEIVK